MYTEYYITTAQLKMRQLYLVGWGGGGGGVV